VNDEATNKPEIAGKIRQATGGALGLVGEGLGRVKRGAESRGRTRPEPERKSAPSSTQGPVLEPVSA